MSGKPWPDHRRQGHGSEAEYRRHYRNGERACPACREAARRKRDGRRQFKRRNNP